MAYGPRSQPLSTRRKLAPGQSVSRVKSTLLEADLTGTTVAYIFDTPITTGSGVMTAGYYISGGLPTIYTCDLFYQDDLTFFTTDLGIQFADIVWLQDAGIWRTQSNGVPIGEPMFLTYL
jgi:hypothetical protein